MKRFAFLALAPMLLVGCVAVPYGTYPDYDAYSQPYATYPASPYVPYAPPYYDPYYVGPGTATFGFGTWGSDHFHHWHGGPAGHMNPGHGHIMGRGR